METFTPKPKIYQEKWNILKKRIFSFDRLNLLNKMVPIELNIFSKEIIETETNTKILYNDICHQIKIKYQLQFNFEPIQLEKPKIESKFKDLDLKDFYSEKVDNTGNVQLWPCEEILSLYCLLNKDRFLNKNIIELGAGFSGLCGLIISKNIPSTNVTLTDGNTKCVEYLQKNIILNGLMEKVKGEHLLWDKNNKLIDNKNKYDFVLISDCIFFKNYHEDLIETIHNLLTLDGICIIISPTRGDTLDKFLQLAEKQFNIYKSKEDIKFYSTIIDVKDSSFSPYFIQMSKSDSY